MAWTDMATQVTGTLITETLWNQIANNFGYLKSRQAANYILNEGSDYSTSSTSFVVIDATNLSLAITSNGSDITIKFAGSMANSGALASNYIEVYVDIDGGGYNAIAGDDGMIIGQSVNAASLVNMSFSWPYQGAVSGSVYTFRLYWKVTGTTGTLYAGAGTGALDMHPQFSVKEI